MWHRSAFVLLVVQAVFWRFCQVATTAAPPSAWHLNKAGKRGAASRPLADMTHPGNALIARGAHKSTLGVQQNVPSAWVMIPHDSEDDKENLPQHAQDVSDCGNAIDDGSAADCEGDGKSDPLETQWDLLDSICDELQSTPAETRHSGRESWRFQLPFVDHRSERDRELTISRIRRRMNAKTPEVSQAQRPTAPPAATSEHHKDAALMRSEKAMKGHPWLEYEPLSTADPRYFLLSCTAPLIRPLLVDCRTNA